VTLADDLLRYLRATAGPAVAYRTPPAPLSGGFDTTTLALCLSGAPPDFSGDLVLRVMPRADAAERIRREAAVHAALVSQGFPAPRIVVAETDAAPLGRPFILMERLAGTTMWAAAVGPEGRLGLLASLSKRLAQTHALLHAVPADALRATIRQFNADLVPFTLAGELQRMASRIERAGLGGLEPGMTWLTRNLPPPTQPEVICHGDFHPLNIMMEGDRLSGVIDWPQAIIAEPAYDVACTRVLLRFGNMGLSGPVRWLVDLVRVLPVRRYTRFYGAVRPLDLRNMAYFECVRALSAMVFAGETPGPNNPWGAPHILAALYRRFERATGVRVRL
jgi:aminoglycoside phosphotransferase (APT) family kinase protein